MNMPGTYLAYSLIGRVFGYSDIGIRIADLMILAVMMVLNWLWMKKISRRAAWFGSVFWGLLYLGFGPTMSLQREYLILIPLLCGLLAFISTTNKSFVRLLGTGFFFGFATIMKPHAGIGLPFLISLEYIYDKNRHEGQLTHSKYFLFDLMLPVVIGFAIPLFIAWLYLWATGAVNNFFDLVSNYLPLYAQISGSHRTISGLDRIVYLLDHYRDLGGFSIWLAPAAIGSLVALKHFDIGSEQRKRVFSLVGLTISYSIYPVVSGQFWTYHWLPFLFFILQTSSLCLTENILKIKHTDIKIARIVLYIIVLLTIPINNQIDFLRGYGYRYLTINRVDEIVAFLKPRLGHDDLVQPLDWTAGAAHAMLILEVRVATPFIYDFHFYHHISNRVTQDLRRKFISELSASQPRFIIDKYGDFRPWVRGADTTREFKELESLIERDYIIIFEGDGYRIYERHDSSNVPPSRTHYEDDLTGETAISADTSEAPVVLF